MSTETTDSINDSIGARGLEVLRNGDYWLAEDGKIYRDEELVANYDFKTREIVYEEEMLKYKLHVGRLMTKYNSQPEATLQGQAGETGAGAAGVDSPSEGVADASEKAEEQRIRKELNKLGPPPPMDWRGEKTPDYVEWRAKYDAVVGPSATRIVEIGGIGPQGLGASGDDPLVAARDAARALAASLEIMVNQKR